MNGREKEKSEIVRHTNPLPLPFPFPLHDALPQQLL
jgi:hypothetical protein